jgi:hypothetical protein
MPVDVVGLNSDASSLSSKSSFVCALTTGGGAKCWGTNDVGQLGNGTVSDRSHDPTPPGDVVGLSSGVQGIDAGGNHACAVTSVGGVLCWGGNFSGEVGDGTTDMRNSPVQAAGLDLPVAAISAGSGHTCAIGPDAAVACWGSNYGGQLGDGGACGFQCLSPVGVVGLGQVLAVDAGAGFTCAVTSAGGAMCWGFNSIGQLGDGRACGDQCTPVHVLGLTSGVAAVTVGDDHACALTTGGGVKCWGANFAGQLGDGGGCGNTCFTPVDVVGLSSGVLAVSAGGSHTCAVLAGGGVKCWGDNVKGQLGDGSTSSRNQPVDVVERRYKDFPGFIFPMGCEINVDCYYVYYIDHDLGGTGLEDFMCGTETYDGHSGTDIILPSFHEMDAGVDVYAAAAGTVVEAKDGHFDRNKFFTVPDFFVPSNYVMIEHPGGLRSLYLHLRRDSVLVGPGDAVEEGEKIGEVGSSGSSSHPHLHFQVFDAGGYTIDPWAGPCGGAESLWREQDPYEDYFILIESYLTLFPAYPAHDPDSIDRLRGSDPILCFSIVALSIHAGDESEFRFVGPGDVPSFVVHHDADQRTPYYGSCKQGSEFRPNPGQWQMQYWLNGDLLASRDFEVGLLAGDATCDGRVDSIDAAIVLQYTAALLGSLACPAGDVNDDGRSDATDAAIILQHVAGLIPL